ncbi:recombinase family protein, partial [Chloroflexota bacterium]
RRDARKGKFDCLVVHKFDRLARDRASSLTVKSLLRHDCGIKVFSVTEPSEDSDGPIGALIEGIMEAVADWYSRNLATEVAKGKLQRAREGYHNNGAPFGYDKTEERLLVINEAEAEALVMAYEWYATGQYSDTEVARKLNEHGFQSKTGRRFSKETIRDLLQNRTYLGKVKYQEYQRNSDGSRNYRAAVQWFEGLHDAILPEELFEQCQQVRQRKAVRKGIVSSQRHPYPLSGLIYCGECGRKLRAQTDYKTRRYRCRAYELGHDCGQKSIEADIAEEQVIAALHALEVPDNWRDKMTQAIAEIVGDQQLDERLKEIREKIDRMDFRWDHGFITDKDAYMEMRYQLQQELEQMTPIPDDDLEFAADVIRNFDKYWAAAKDNAEEQERLLNLMLIRVWAEDGEITQLHLRPNLHVAAGLNTKRPTEISVDLSSYRSGSDGGRARACIPLVLFPQHVAVSYISKLVRNSGYEQAIVLPVYVPNLMAETQVMQFC